MEYHYKPRKVEAGQWDPNNPGPVTELMDRHHIHWETYHDGLLVIDPKRAGIGVHPADWVVIDEGCPVTYPDALFHHWFAPQPTRDRDVRNTIVGNVNGTIIQSGGTLRM